MKVCVILNPGAGSADQAHVLHEAVAAREHWTLRETQRAGDAARLSREAARAGFETVVAAGGDGTVNEVVNGLSRNLPQARLGIVPLGTGNDLPRTLAIPDDPIAAMQLIESGQERRIDLIRVTQGRRRRLCVNVAAGGFTGQVSEAVTGAVKDRWGPLAYLRGAVGVLPDLTQYQTTIRFDGKAREPLAAMNVIVANGRTAGGGMAVAPRANPEDGLLDVVVVQPGSVLDLTGVVARLLAGDYTGSDNVLHRRAKRVQIESTPGMTFNVDGELLSDEPITFNILPQALRVIVGPEYRAEA